MYYSTLLYSSRIILKPVKVSSQMRNQFYYISDDTIELLIKNPLSNAILCKVCKHGGVDLYNKNSFFEKRVELIKKKVLKAFY